MFKTNLITFVVTWNPIQYIQIFLDFMGPKTAQNISSKDLPDFSRTGRLQCLSYTGSQNILGFEDTSGSQPVQPPAQSGYNIELRSGCSGLCLASF